MILLFPSPNQRQNTGLAFHFPDLPGISLVSYHIASNESNSVAYFFIFYLFFRHKTLKLSKTWSLLNAFYSFPIIYQKNRAGIKKKRIPVKQNRLNDNCLTCVIKEYLLSFKRRGWRSKRFSEFAFLNGTKNWKEREKRSSTAGSFISLLYTRPSTHLIRKVTELFSLKKSTQTGYTVC